MSKLRTYTELSQLKTFEQRYEYLKLNGQIGSESFGNERYLNQKFYRSKVWKNIRDQVILRDNGCDLGHPDRPISRYEHITVHHMNPITPEDILNHTDYLLNPEYLISVTDRTHKAIHYGSKENLTKDPIERKPYDTVPWKN